MRSLETGQRTQLGFEHSGSKELPNVAWHVVALHCDPPVASYEKQIPRAFRNVLLVRLYGWLYAIKKSSDYDVVLFRDLQLDPFGPLLGWFVRNRITVHHSLEIEELRLLNKPRLFKQIAVVLEKIAKPITQRSALGLVAVTRQILAYERQRFPWLSARSRVYPNGAHIQRSTFQVEQRGAADKFHAIFVASEFSEWHGLDRLLEALEDDPETARQFVFHLVGRISSAQLSAVEAVAAEIVVHGSISNDELEELLLSTDIAINSLALERKGFEESSNLKVRSYLAAGVPVYSNHPDTAFDSKFQYYKNDEEGFSITGLASFVGETLHATRTEVREASRPYIEKRQIMMSLLTDLREWTERSGRERPVYQTEVRHPD